MLSALYTKNSSKRCPYHLSREEFYKWGKFTQRLHIAHNTLLYSLFSQEKEEEEVSVSYSHFIQRTHQHDVHTVALDKKYQIVYDRTRARYSSFTRHIL
jgi:hypothetical protein